jgi:hypothetical protein
MENALKNSIPKRKKEEMINAKNELVDDVIEKN